MPDLICLIPNHGYADETSVFVSWLGGIFFVHDPDQNSFKLEVTVDGDIVQFTDTITDGFVREDNEDATVTITELDHLEGENVVVTSGGSFIGLFLVEDGSITLNSPLTTYQVGLPYIMKVRTMRLSNPQEGATVQSRIKRIDRTVVRFIRSLGGQAGQEYAGVEYLQNIEATFSDESQDTPPNNRLTQGGFSEDAYTTIISSDPVPFTVLATIVDVEIEK